MPTLDELFEMMPNAFDAEKAKDINATVQFDLTGEGGINITLKLQMARSIPAKERPMTQPPPFIWTPTIIRQWFPES